LDIVFKASLSFSSLDDIDNTHAIKLSFGSYSSAYKLNTDQHPIA